MSAGTSHNGATAPGFPTTNREFLQGLFGRNWPHVHVCAIPGDPNDPTIPRGYWAGGPAHPGLAACQPDTNNYYCVGLFAGARQLANFRALVILGIDDVGPKVDPAKVRDLLGEPSYRIETSPGNEHWGYRLRPPLAHGDGAVEFQRAVRKWLTAKDPGMEGLNRYLRLPFGRNGKAECGPGGFTTRLVFWTGRMLEESEVGVIAGVVGVAEGVDAGPMGAPTGVAHTTATVASQADLEADPLLRALLDLGLVQNGPRPSPMGATYDITCPWVHEHTGRATSGTVYVPVRTKFRCQHGHCEKRTHEHLRLEVERLLREDSGGLQGLVHYEFDKVDPATVVLPALAPTTPATEGEVRFLTDTIYVRSEGKQKFWSISRRVQMDDDGLDTTWADALRDVLPEKTRPGRWYRGHPGRRVVDGFISWPGTGPLVKRRDRILANRWLPPATMVPVVAKVADQDVEPWLSLVHHVLGASTLDEAEALEHALDWLAMIVGSWIKPGWHVVVTSDVEGLGKDVMLVPVARALGEMAVEIAGAAITDQNNPWAQARFVQVAEMKQTTRGTSTAHDQMNVIKLWDNTRETVRIKDKYTREYEARNIYGMWFSSNEEAPVRLSRNDRRLMVFNRHGAALNAPLVDRYLAWMDAEVQETFKGWQMVHAWLVQRWTNMPDYRLKVLQGRAPMTAGKQAVIDASMDEIETWMLQGIMADPPAPEAWPNIVWPVWVHERLGHAKRHGIEGISVNTPVPGVARIVNLLRKIGAVPLNNGKQIRVGGKPVVLWAVKDKTFTLTVSPADLAKIAGQITTKTFPTHFDA